MQNCSPRKVFIRTDSNKTMASGHVMRCLSLADALAEAGAEVVFVTSDDTPQEVIEARGFPVAVLGSDWRNLMDGLEQLMGLCETLPFSPVILIDTYSITKECVDALSEVARVCYLGSKGGDLGNLSLLINYSTRVDPRAYERLYAHRATRLLLGPKYAPLRKQFSQGSKAPVDSIGRVLVTTGNTDPRGFVPRFLEAVLADEVLRSVNYEVVVGGMFSCESAIEKVAEESGVINLNRGIRDMAPLMEICDAAVSANGTTVYELSAMGVPAVTFAMVDEQEVSAKSFAELGCTAYAGSLSEGVAAVAEKAAALLRGFVEDPGCAEKLAGNAHRLIDGGGAGRIAKEVVSL